MTNAKIGVEEKTDAIWKTMIDGSAMTASKGIIIIVQIAMNISMKMNVPMLKALEDMFATSV